MQPFDNLLRQESLGTGLTAPKSLYLDPFYEHEDDFLPQESLSHNRSYSLLPTSPLTPPEKSSLQSCITPSSSRSSSASSGRAILRAHSKRISPVQGLALLRRNMELMRISKDVRLVEHAVRTVRELMCCEFVNESHVMENGVVEAACNLLKAHKGVSSLMEEVCRFLASICESSYEAREIATSLNGIMNIRTVMEIHFQLYASTVDAAMKAMGVLCAHESVVRVQVRKERCLEWILVCVRQWRDMRTLQNSALICLTSALMNEEESKHYAVCLGVIQELLYIMHRFQEDSSVQKNALRLLNVLISDSKEYRLSSATEGAVERVIHALKFFCTKSQIVLAAAKACDYYCINSKTRDCFITERGVETLLEAVQETARREREFRSLIHRHAICYSVRALARVSLNSQTRSLMSRRENLSSVLNAVSQYETDDIVVEAVCKLFRNLTTEDGDKAGFQALFFKGGLTPGVSEQIASTCIRLLDTKTGNAKIAEHVCTALLNLCEQGRTHIVKRSCPNLPRVLQEIVERHSEDKELAELAISVATRIR